MKQHIEQIRLYPDKALKIFLSNILKPFGSFKYKRFIILSRKRTGSSLMHSFLNASPYILARGEVFQVLKQRNHRDILNWVFSRHPFFIKAVGFKIHYDHPADNYHCGIWDDLKAMENLRVIHLTRKNILRSYLSEKIAKESGVWATKNSAGTTGNRMGNKAMVDFSVEELTNVFEKTQAYEQTAVEMFTGHPILDMHYEALANNPETEINRVADFLNIPHFHPRTKLKKQNPRKLSDMIFQYHELKDAFSNTPWQDFFIE